MRNPSELSSQQRGLTAISGAMSLIAVLLMVQIWLLSAALETFLSGDMTAQLSCSRSAPASFSWLVLVYICSWSGLTAKCGSRIILGTPALRLNNNRACTGASPSRLLSFSAPAGWPQWPYHFIDLRDKPCKTFSTLGAQGA